MKVQSVKRWKGCVLDGREEENRRFWEGFLEEFKKVKHVINFIV